MSSRPKRNTTTNSKSYEEIKSNDKVKSQKILQKNTKQNKKAEEEQDSNQIAAHLLFKSYSWRKDTHGLFDYQEDQNRRTKCLIQPIEIERKFFNFNKQEPTLLLKKIQSSKTKEKNQKSLILKNKDQELNSSFDLQNIQNISMRKQNQQKQENKFKNSQFLCFFRNSQNEINVIKISKQDQQNEEEVIRALSCYINNSSQHLICCALLYQSPKQKKMNIRWYAGKQSNKIKPDLQKTELTDMPFVNSLPCQVEKFSTPSLIVRSLKVNKFQERGYELHLNDIIKMGRTQLQVVSIDGQKCHQMFDEQEKKAVDVPDNVANVDQYGKEQEIQCKYCYMTIVQEDNFFLIPCKCSGFMSFVHYECLLNWIKSKVSIQTSKNVTMYMQNKLKCQVCLAQFPKFFRHKGKIYPIMPYKVGEKHLILKNISQKVQDKNGQLTVIINGVQNSETKIGRAKENQLRLTDITVSRQHATLKYMDGKYIIFDNRSKFGTTIRIKSQPLQMELNQKWKGIQVGKTIIMSMFQINQAIEQEKLEHLSQMKQQQDQNTNIYSNKNSNKKVKSFNVSRQKKVLFKNIQSEQTRKQEQRKKQKMEREKLINEIEQNLPGQIQKRNQRSDDSQQNPLNMHHNISPNTPLMNPYPNIYNVSGELNNEQDVISQNLFQQEEQEYEQQGEQQDEQMNQNQQESE